MKILAISVLHGTSFLDWIVKIKFPTERKIVPYYSQAVPILIVYEASVDNQKRTKFISKIHTAVFSVEKEKVEFVMHVVRATIVHLTSETPVSVKKRRAELYKCIRIRSSGNSIRAWRLRNHECYPRIPSRILFVSASSSIHIVAKYQLVAISCSPPVEITSQ